MASNGRIKGITIEIGGDTQGLDKALSGVNKNIKSTQTELKDVERLLKLDPSNTELMAQKHRMLAQAVGETKEKLATLKEAASQANEALARGEISQSQYDGLQREIIATEESLRSLEQQANQSAVALQKIGAVGESLKNAGDKIAGVGSTLTKNVTAPVVGIGAMAVKTASDFDSAMSQVGAVSGATGKDLQELRDKAREMGSKTKFSASEAAEAMNYMAMAGWKTGDMLNGIEGVMNLAAASGEDLASTSDIVTDALTAFGMTAADSGHFADILAAASSNANTDVAMMGETFKYCAPIAGALGFTAEDTAEAIGLMGNAGIKASQAGTSLRTIMSNLSGEVKICGNNIGEVTIATTKADGSMRDLSDILADCRVAFIDLSESEQASAAEALVGKNAMSGFLALMNAAPADIEKVSNAIENCDGKSAEMAATMQDNLEGQLTILKSQLEELAISFGEILMPAIRQIVTWVQGFVDKLNNMDEGTKKTIVTIGLLAAAIGPILIVIGKVITAIGTIFTAISKIGPVINIVKTAVTGLFTILSANPIALVVAAVAALIAAFVALWNNCEGFREFWIGLWEGIKSIVGAAVDFIVGLFRAVVNFVQNNWQGLLMLLVNPFAGAFKLIYDNCEGFRTFWDNLWNTIKEVVMVVWNGIKDFLVNVWKVISETAQTIWNGLKDFIAGIWDAVAETAQEVWNGIRDFLVGIWNAISEITQTVWNGIKNFLVSIWNGITEIAQTVWNGIKNVIETITNAISDFLIAAWNAMKNAIVMIMETIQNVITTVWNAIKSVVTVVLDAIKNIVISVWETIKTAIITVLETIKSVVVSAWEAIKTAISAAMEAIKTVVIAAWEAIKSAVSAAIESIRKVVIAAWEAIKTAVISIMEAIKSVITAAWESIKSAVLSIMNAIKEVVISIWNSIKTTVTSIVSGLKDAVVKVFSSLLDGIKSVMGNVLGAVKDGFNAAIDFIKSLPAQALEWGRDIIGGLVDGIKSMIGNLVDSVKDVAGTIASFLHFSEPDVGPLSNFHTFMPDMIDLLVKGINDNIGRLQGPMNELAQMLVPMTGSMGYMALNGMNGEGSNMETKMDSMYTMLTKYLPRLAGMQVVLNSGALIGELSDGLNRQFGRGYL